MLSVDEAGARVRERSPLLGDEELPLACLVGRVLAEDVRSDLDLPPFDRAAMDGYALRAADAARPGARLRVVDRVRAGQPSERALGPGEAAQIMTGAPVPPGADAVVQVEHTRAGPGGSEVELFREVAEGTNIAPRGSEVRAGEVVLERGRLLDPAAVGVLAAVGRPRVRVGRRPKLAIVVTGDELVEPDALPGPGQIRNSNGPTLAALAGAAGAEVVSSACVADELGSIEAALRSGLDASDVLIVSGGVSAGEYDLVEPALARLGVEIAFDGVALKPGAPLVFGTRGAKLVFGVPGNPVSAQVTFAIFVQAALLRMQGAAAGPRPRLEAELLGRLGNRSGRRAYLPGVVRVEAGRLVAQPIRSAGSADLVAHARANALLVLDAERTEARAGERVPALLLEPFLEGALG